MKIDVTPAPVLNYDKSKTVRDLFLQFEQVSKRSENSFTNLMCAATLYGNNLLEGYMSIEEASGLYETMKAGCGNCPACHVCPVSKFNE